MVRKTSPLALGASLAACTLLNPLGSDLTSGDGSLTGDASLDVSGEGSSGDGASVDAAPDVDLGPCDPSVRVLPSRAFDASPVPGFVCALDNVLAENGQLAGLDRGPDEGRLDGKGVTGCLGVELPRTIDQVVVRAAPVAQACATKCSSNCGTGHDMLIFAGSSETTLRYVGGPDMTSTELTDYTLALPVGVVSDIRFIAVCRTGWGDSRDDIGIDVIHGRCR
jgi:hypothetical protein